jgi:tetratricopeptide (TPR) repeat protein/ribosomal protein L32
MVKFCPSCGTKLEKEYNFCPECGFDLRNISESESAEEIQETHKEEVVICDNCGEENPADNRVCKYCGALLKGEQVEKTVTEKKPVREKIKESKPKENKSKENRPKQNKLKTTSVKKSSPAKPKELDQKKLLMIFGGVLVVIFIILWSSGVLSSNEPEQVAQTQVTGQNSGVDLNNIQRINALEAKVKSNPDDTASLLELAHLKNDSGLYEQAIVDYQKYLEKNPSDPDARIDMGVCYYNLHNYDEAIQQMEKALKYSPDHQIGYLNLGIVNLTAGNFEKSQEWLKKAVQIDPNSDIGKKAQELLESHKK